MRAVVDACNRRNSPNPDAPRDQLNPRRPLASATSGGPDGPQEYQQTKRVMRDRRVIARVAACRHAARAALPAVRRQARMICDPQGSNEVNVQDGALVHKAPLRPVGRSCASALVSAKDQQCRHRPVVDRRPRKPDAGCSIHPAGTVSLFKFLSSFKLCARGGTGRRTALRMRRVTPWGFNSLRAHQFAEYHAPVAKRPKAPVLHAGIPPFESEREYQPAAGAKPAATHHQQR